MTRTDTPSKTTVGRFPCRNKNDTLEENDTEIRHGNYVVRVDVVEEVTMTTTEWAEFTENFLSDRDWLDGKGGSGSAMIEGEKRWCMRCLLVCNEQTGERVLVNPKGYGYACYVGRIDKNGWTSRRF